MEGPRGDRPQDFPTQLSTRFQSIPATRLECWRLSVIGSALAAAFWKAPMGVARGEPPDLRHILIASPRESRLTRRIRQKSTRIFIRLPIAGRPGHLCDFLQEVHSDRRIC